MRRKLCVITLILILLINILAIHAKAVFSFSTTMTPNNTKVPVGSEFMISVKLSNLDVGEDGINTFTAVLGYDKEVFEAVTASNVDGSNNWMPAFATGTGKITLTKTSLVTADEEIMQISLKVKEGVASGTKGEVSLSTILAASPESEISCSDVSTTITVGEGSSNDGEGNNAPINEVEPPENNVVSQNPIVVNEAENNANELVNNNNGVSVYGNEVGNEVENKSEDDMPYTGTDTSSYIKVTTGIIIIALLIYRKMREFDDI